MGALAKAAFRLRHAGAVVPWVLIYYATSIGFVAGSKSVLLKLPQFPMMLSFMQCAISAVLARIWLAASGQSVMRGIPAHQWRLVIAAGATGWLGFACANFACSAMNASLVETIKATTPLPQVVIAGLFGNGWPTRHARRALTVIVCGVILASLADTSGCAMGFVAAILMNVNLASSDNFMKLGYQLPGAFDGANLWYRTAQVSAVVGAPAALAELALSGGASAGACASVAPMVFLSAFAFNFYNISICELLNLVPMPTFAVLGSGRRAVTIMALTLIFRTHVTPMNFVGLCIAAMGFGHFIRGPKSVAASRPCTPEGKSPLASITPCTTSTFSPSGSSSRETSVAAEEDGEWLAACPQRPAVSV